MSANTQQALTQVSEIDPKHIVIIYERPDGQVSLTCNNDLPVANMLLMHRVLGRHIDTLLFTPPKPSPILKVTP